MFFTLLKSIFVSQSKFKVFGIKVQQKAVSWVQRNIRIKIMDSLLTCNKLKEESDSFYKHLQSLHYYKKNFL